MNNNQLVHKYQYYLNESHRLNEELKSEQEYSELLESLLFEILNEEQLDESSWKNKLLAALAGLGIGFSGGAAAGSAPHVFSAAKPEQSMKERIQAAQEHKNDAVTRALHGAAIGSSAGAVAATIGGNKKKGMRK
jgi:hypothetical protein